jgi:hypothetical protein
MKAFILVMQTDFIMLKFEFTLAYTPAQAYRLYATPLNHKFLGETHEHD